MASLALPPKHEQGQGPREGWSYMDTPGLWQERTQSPCCSSRHHQLR